MSNSSDSYELLLRDLQDVRMSVIKISNISWDLSSTEVIEYLCSFILDKAHIHIPIDRQSGKTKAEMFVELPSILDAIKCIARYNNRLLKGRIVQVSLSSLEELYSAHFFLNQSELMSQAEAYSLVNICKNYKVHATIDINHMLTFLIRHTFQGNAQSAPLSM